MTDASTSSNAVVAVSAGATDSDNDDNMKGEFECEFFEK